MARSRTHGLTNSPAYRSWQMMINRCTNPKSSQFDDYGGRGITVCERWLASFEAFLEDMGPRPAGRSIERVDNDGPYEAGNCVWATRTTQARNTRRRRTATYAGETLPIAEWAERLGVSYFTIYHRTVTHGSPLPPGQALP